VRHVDTFDKDRIRQALEGPAGYNWLLLDTLESARSKQAIGFRARLMLNDAVRCLLVHLESPAERLALRAVEWSRRALEEAERGPTYEPLYSEAMLWTTIAFGTWITQDLHDSESYSKVAEHLRRYHLQTPLDDKVSVSLTLVEYLDAAACEEALDVFERTPNLRPPKDPLALQFEAGLVYVRCAHTLTSTYSYETVGAATDRFLKKNVNTWLTRGQATRAARWMKVVHWNADEGRSSAHDTILRCYDYLDPGSKRRGAPTSW
jgi:hypothetical protein